MNLHDYLLWRGDLPFADVPMNDVDHLILGELSYVNFMDVLTEQQKIKGLTIAEAAEHMLAYDPEGKKTEQTFYLWKDLRQLLSEIRTCPRFALLELSRFVRIVDDSRQFSVFCVRVSEKQYVIPYQGTDSSLIGWEEDLRLALDKAIPSQIAALRYFEEAASELNGTFVLSGHSKGGNLAIYAAAHADSTVRARVEHVYSFDGPGFTQATLSSPGYRAIEQKITHFVPEYSLVGLLLTHTVNNRVVKSNGIGIMQHSGFTWQIQRDAFVSLPALNQGSRKAGAAIAGWLDQLTEEQRLEFVTLLCDSLERLQVERLEDIRLPALMRVPNVIRTMATIGHESKKEVFTAIRQVILDSRIE